MSKQVITGYPHQSVLVTAEIRKLVDENLMVRRINIRQVLPVRKEFDVKVNPGRFKRYKQEIRESIDRVMLERIAPRDTVLKDVFMEINDGNVTFGRQIGSYPLLIGVPYRLECGKRYDIMVTDWGFRSITGLEYPFRINHETMSAISSRLRSSRKARTLASPHTSGVSYRYRIV